VDFHIADDPPLIILTGEDLIIISEEDLIILSYPQKLKLLFRFSLTADSHH
jgi:hypothetical protein